MSSSKHIEELPVIRKSDLENHNKDGGMWIVIKGKVYDIQEFRLSAPCGTDILQYYAGQDATQIWEMSNHSKKARQLMQSYFVGNFMDPDQEVVQVVDASTFSSPLMDTERTLAMLIGIYSNALSQGHPQSSFEVENEKWILSDFMRAGCQTVQPPDPYDEEKGEKGSSATTPGSVTTPGDLRPPKVLERPHSNVDSYFTNLSDCFLNALLEGKLHDVYVQVFLKIIDKEVRSSMLNNIHMNFTQEHPIEEVGRHLTATLLKHNNLTPRLIEIIEQGTF